MIGFKTPVPVKNNDLFYGLSRNCFRPGCPGHGLNAALVRCFCRGREVAFSIQQPVQVPLGVGADDFQDEIEAGLVPAAKQV